MRLLRFAIFLLLCSIFVFGLVTFAGEWVDVDGKWKYKVGDDFVRNEIQWIGNKPYSFDDDGNIKTGVVDINGYLYLYDTDGSLIKNSSVRYSGITYVTNGFGRLKEKKVKDPDYDFDNSDGTIEGAKKLYLEKIEIKKKNQLIQESIKAEKNKKREIKKLKFGEDVSINSDLTFMDLHTNELLKSMWVKIVFNDGDHVKEYTYYLDENGNRLTGPNEVEGKYYLFIYETFDVKKEYMAGNETRTYNDYHEHPEFTIGSLKKEYKSYKEYYNELIDYQNRGYNAVKSGGEQNKPKTVQIEAPTTENYINDSNNNIVDNSIVDNSMCIIYYACVDDILYLSGTPFGDEFAVKGSVLDNVKKENVYYSNNQGVWVNENFDTSKVNKIIIISEIIPTDNANIFSMSNVKEIVNLGNINFSKKTNLRNFFYNLKSITSIDLTGCNLNNLNDVSNMFYGCSSLKSVKFDQNAFSKFENISELFSECTSLEEFDFSSYDMRNIKNMSRIFNSCTNLKTVSFENCQFNEIINIDALFDSCLNLNKINFKNVHMKNIENLSGICANLINLEEVDFENSVFDEVSSMKGFFENCANLKTVNFNNVSMKNLVDIQSMFRNCKSITNIDLSKINADNITSMDGLFSECENLESVNISNLKYPILGKILYMFYNCKSIKEIDLTSFKPKEAHNISELIIGCTSLQKIYINKDSLFYAIDDLKMLIEYQ